MFFTNMIFKNTAMFKVNRLLFRHYNLFKANNEISKKTLYPLKNRKLLNVSGPEASLFLQGLITNDMGHLDNGAKSMYAMFLNNKGRVLYDTLILKGDTEDTYMIECDKTVGTLLYRHLKLYKLKRNVEIGDLSQQFKVWAFISEPIKSDFEDSKTGIKIYNDPRVIDLGHRIVTPVNTKEAEVLSIVGDNAVLESDDKGYKQLRYQLGVSEGADELPPGTSFPLEANCDYLHGVSFHKGCYIGQELTARVHHTGVVRKRIMPIIFKSVSEFQIDSKITSMNNPKLNLGKLRAFSEIYGLGLIRVKEALETPKLVINNQEIEVKKPSWWPIEAPKEKAAIAKSEEDLYN